MKNICRPFELYNDFLPPKRDSHKEWQYLSFGYNDGISIGGNLFDNNKPDLRVMWDYYVQNHTDSLDGSFSCQIIFGLRYEKENEVICDRDFWNREVQLLYPFLFVSLIQLDKSTDIIKYKENLEKGLNDPAKRKAITYLTFDGSDLILILLCKKYSDGAKTINCLRCCDDENVSKNLRKEIIYSFTIGSVFKEVLNEDSLVDRIGDQITHAYIYIIEKKPGGGENIYKMIKRELGHFAVNYLEEREKILGCNDEMIIMKNIPWKLFLRFYRDKTGVLNHSHEDFGSNLIGVTTIIGERLNSSSGVASSIADMNIQSFCEHMRNRCNKTGLFMELGSGQGVKSSLSQMINSLQKFESLPFSDYLFQTNLLTLNMVISMAEEVKERNMEADFFASFYNFIKGINLFAQNSARSDRQFTQSPDLNIRLYEAPVKMNAFYNAFIFQLRKYLNEFDMKREEGAKHQYEFLTCPGTTRNMQMLELFKGISNTKRLFLVEIPENQVYNPQVMMVMLAHEVGHVVGTGIRNRERRRKYANQITAKISANYMRANLNRFFSDKFDVYRKTGMEHSFNKKWEKELDWENYWQTTEANLVAYLDDFTKCENYLIYIKENKFVSDDRQQMEKVLNLVKERFEYSETIKLSLSDGVVEVFSDDGVKLWPYLTEHYYISWLKKNAEKAKVEKELLKLEIERLIRKGNSFSPWNSELFSISQAVNKVMYLFQECSADLIGILTLRISMKEYLGAIVQSVEDQGFFEDFNGSILHIRSSIVTFCMQEEHNGIYSSFSWSEADLREFDDTHQKLNLFKKEIVKFIREYLNEGSGDRHSEIIPEKAIDALLSTDILALMIEYLLECRAIFESENSKKTNDLQQDLMQAYRIFDSESIEEIEQKVQKYLEQYSKELQKELDKHMNEGI